MEFFSKMETGNPPQYLCDPDKNIKCLKTTCQVLCFHTRKKEYAKDPTPLYPIHPNNKNKTEE